MADELIGGIGVTVTADYAPLITQLNAASSAAEAGGQAIASSLTGGMNAGSEAADRLAEALGSYSQASSASVASSKAAAAGFEQMATGAGHGVTQIQALSGGIRVLEGSQGIRAAERFLASIPGIGAAFQAAFPLIGLAAISEMFSRIGEEIHKAFDQAMNAPQVIQSAFRNLNETLHESNDELQLTNDKLRDDIAKIEGHPSNGLMVALDEARVAADKLEISLLKDLTASTKLFADNKENMMEALNLLPGGGSDFAQISQEAQKFQGQIQQTIDKYKTTSAAGNGLQLPKIPGLDKLSGQLQQQEKAKESVELAKQYSAEIDKLSDRLQAAQRHSSGLYTSEVASLEGLIDLYKEQRAQIDLTQQKTGLDKTKAGLPDKGAYRRAEEEQKKADDEALAMLQADHQMTLAETASFWKERLSAESGYTDRVREIHITLGHIYQQSDKAIMEGAKKGDEILKEQENKAKEFVAKMAALAHEADDLGERLHQEDIKRAEEISKAQNEQTASDKETQLLEQKTKLQTAYAVEVSHTTAQEEAYQSALKENADQLAQIKVDEAAAALQTAQDDGDAVKIAQARLALEKSINAEKLRQLDIAAKQQVEDARNSIRGGIKSGLGDTSFSDTKTLASVQLVVGAVNGISSALANAVFHSKDLAKSFATLGKDLAIQTLTTGLHAALGALVKLVPGFAQVAAAQTAAAAQGKAVTSANNVASVTSYAAVAAAAAAAAEAGIPIVGPALAAAAAASTFAAVMAYAPLAAYASGGDPDVGVPALVGERGPEIFVPRVPGTIIPNHAITSGGGSASLNRGGFGSGGTTHQTFNVMTNSPRQTAREISTYIKSQTPKYAPYSNN